MSDPAAPPAVGRRLAGPPVATAIFIAAYLIAAPPLFLLGPLALLLLFSRPKTPREWFWIAVTAAGAGYVIADVVSHPTTDNLIITALALFLTAAFLICCHAFPTWSPVARALGSLAIAATALIAWGTKAGLSMTEIDSQVETALRAMVPQVLGPGTPAAQVNAAVAAIPIMIQLAPGLIAFQALVGLGLAWRWHHRIATNPLPPPSGPFTLFRFGDQLIWGAIFTLGLVLLPLGPAANRLAQVALVVWTGLYATRGLAVTAAATARWSILGRLLVTGLAFLAMPVAIGTLITLGLADVWIDFRRRAAGPPFGEEDSHGSNSA